MMVDETAAANADVAGMSFEEAFAELEKIVRQLEEGRGKLDDAIQSYERGMALKRHCETKLKDAQTKIDRITLAADGSVGLTPFEAS
jgi:exodeoxyribonuclease VII small subunit